MMHRATMLKSGRLALPSTWSTRKSFSVWGYGRGASSPTLYLGPTRYLGN